MTTMRVVGECFFWYRLTRVVPDKFQRAVKQLCVCVCVCFPGQIPQSRKTVVCVCVGSSSRQTTVQQMEKKTVETKGSKKKATAHKLGSWATMKLNCSKIS